MKNLSELQTIAAALYDGGWRAEDKEQLISEYDYTVDESDDLDAICELLKSFADRSEDQH